MWKTITERSPDAKLELIDAYTRLFNGEGKKEDAEIVLGDILHWSRYFNITPEGSDLARAEGRREVAGRIFSLVNLADWERTAIYNAARQNAIIDQTKGEL